MIFKQFVVAVCLLSFSFATFSHEGHDNGIAKSMHGGIVKKTKNTYIEVLQDESIDIYISNHDYKNIISSNLKISINAIMKNKKTPIEFKISENHLKVITDLKKEKHFKLNINVMIEGKEESVVFPLEN